MTKGNAFSRRAFLQFSLASGAALTLAACAPGGGGGGAGGGRKTFVWQAIPAYSQQSPDHNRVDYIKQVLSSFQQASGFSVEAQITGSDANAAMSKLVQQANQGTAPDVTMIDTYLAPRFSERLTDLSPVLAKAGIAVDDWFPNLQGAMLRDGTPVVLPMTTDLGVLYYRKDLVDTPPASWDDVYRIGKNLAAQGKYFSLPAGNGASPIMYSVLAPYLAQGAEIMGPDGGPGFADGDGYDAMLGVLEYIERCVRDGITPSKVASYVTVDDQNADILAGQVGMFLHGSWFPRQYATLGGTGDFYEEWGVAPIPSANGTEFATIAGGWSYGMFIDDEPDVVEAAGDFLVDGWIGDEGMAEWCSIAGFLPARSSVYDSPSYEANPFTETFREHLDKYARVRPADEGYAAVASALGAAASGVASGARSPKDALKDAIAQS